MENEIVVKKTSGWVKFLKIALAVAAVATVAIIVYNKFFKKKKKAKEELAAEAEEDVAELPVADEVAEVEEAPFEVAAEAVIDNAENMDDQTEVAAD